MGTTPKHGAEERRKNTQQCNIPCFNSLSHLKHFNNFIPQQIQSDWVFRVKLFHCKPQLAGQYRFRRFRSTYYNHYMILTISAIFNGAGRKQIQNGLVSPNVIQLKRTFSVQKSPAPIVSNAISLTSIPSPI